MEGECVRKIRVFDDVTSNQEELVNNFLEKLGKQDIVVTPMYNTILGGIVYVILYWD